MTGKTKKIITNILIIIFVMTLAFIWGNSMDSRQVSSGKSGYFVDFIMRTFRPFLDKFNITTSELGHFVRKMAHFSEYFLLGLEVGFLAILVQKHNYHYIIHGFSLGLASAVVDESIQILSHRGPSVSDVMLDFLGYSIAFGVVTIISLCARWHKNKQKQDEQE